MKLPPLLVLAATLVLFAPFVQADSHPDFSGAWMMDVARSESTHQNEPIDPFSLVIKQDGSWISVETIQGARHYTIIYKLDGTQNVNQLDAGVAVSRMHWDGSALVTETIHDVQGAATTLVQIHRLSSDGNEMRVESTMRVEHGYTGTSPLAAALGRNYGTGTDVFVKKP